MVAARTLSVIIPVFNEATALPQLLGDLKRQHDIALDVIVVDGGSTDGSQQIVESLDVRLLISEKSRAKQLNAGSRSARYNNLLFIHADSSFEDIHLLSKAYDFWQNHDSDKVAGHFAINFSQTDNRHKLAFSYLSEKSASNRLHTINGDQGLLITKSFFEEVGGYNEAFPVMEDQCIANEIFKQGCWVVLPGSLTTSGRRFETEGFHRRYILMSLMMGLYWTGAHQFFRRAKAVYVDQQDAKKLKLWPFFHCVWQMLYQDFGFKRSLVQWYKVGRYVRQNSWQMFFFVDTVLRVKLGVKAYAFTHFHDKIIYPITNNVIGNVIVTPLVFFWYMIVLGPTFYIVER